MNPDAEAPSFHVFLTNDSSRRTWLRLWEESSSREVFAHPGYLGLFLGAGERGFCAVLRSPKGLVIYPGIMRDLRELPYWRGGSTGYFDLVSPPFGYTGPFAECAVEERNGLIDAFVRCYGEWRQRVGVIAEYATCSPLWGERWGFPGEVIVRAPTVIRDLGPTEEEIWADYKGSVRTDIRTATRLGVKVDIDVEGGSRRSFLRIYQATMQRRSASKSYELTTDVLDALVEQLPSSFAFFSAFHGGEACSTELVLISGRSTFFFRGGTLEEKLRTRANLLLKHEVILWSRRSGKGSYLLGGGNVADDSLFRYKKSFAPSGVRGLRVGKAIVNAEIYKDLVQRRRDYERALGRQWTPQPGFFPEYRAPGSADNQ